ncbi:unnamed protein product [Phytomonas sp. EM1]|nr:unnamed protein product [Phytomonas sp. EM1]|eukprot:CCW60093.1 unnamed protein product [Phytomonas sp. isolate EM1]
MSSLNCSSRLPVSGSVADIPSDVQLSNPPPHDGGSSADGNAFFSLPSSPKVPEGFDSPRESGNWLIHQLFIRQEYAACLAMVETQLRESEGLCAYALFVKGLLKRIDGALMESLGLLQTAVLIAPRSVANRKELGRAFLLCGFHEEAIAAFEEAESLAAAQHETEDWEIRYGIGKCYMGLGQYENAVHAFMRSSGVQYHDAITLQLGEALSGLKDYSSAIRLCEAALRNSPSNPALFELLGKLYTQENRTQEAFQCFSSCLRLDPTNELALAAVSSVFHENAQYEVALGKYGIALARMPDSAELWGNVGGCFFAQKKTHAAVACLRKSLLLDPFEWKTHYNLATTYLSLGRYVSAFHHISASITLNPKYAPSYMLLGVCLSLAKDLDNACEAYEKAISLREGDLLLRLNYAVTLLNHARVEEGTIQFQVALSIWNESSAEQRSKASASLLRTLKFLQQRLKGGEGEVVEGASIGEAAFASEAPASGGGLLPEANSIPTVGPSQQRERGA